VDSSSWPIDRAEPGPARRRSRGQSGTRRRAHRRARTVGRTAPHVFVLTTFAFAQPLFDLLGRNAEFFTVRGSTRADIVAFTLGVLLIPPAILLGIEAIAIAFGVLVWRTVHVAIVGGLFGVVVLEALHTQLGGGIAVIVLAALGGLAASAVYLAKPAVRSFLTVLAPAPLILAFLFLFHSPVARLLSPEEKLAAASSAPEVKTQTPVVLIVFDEFSTIALLDGHGRIDARRYPNFARLARTSTWYRDTTTVHGFTQDAVPAILTGQLPEEDTLAIYSDHPQSIFTLLYRSYRLEARESLTRLCPKQLCPRQRDEEVVPGTPAGTADSFASDITVLYLHTLMPTKLADRLPPIDGSWRNFRGGGAARAAAGVAAQATAEGNPTCFSACRFVDALESAQPGTAYVLHLLLPHGVWNHLPSGESYIADERAFPEATDVGWTDSPTLTDVAYARYLLQVGATDRALGLMLERLEARHVLDDALVVVVADHGLSFEPGEARREPTAKNLDEVAFVPLFVKLPKQRRGRERPGLARTVDVLPTIADALGVEIPWPVDGQSLLHRQLERDGTVTIWGNHGRVTNAQLSDLLARREGELRAQTDEFGSGAWARMYARGPLAPLAGREVAALGAPPASGVEAQLDGKEFFERVDPASGIVPAYVTGRLEGGLAGWDVAVAMNGRVRATAVTYDAADGVRFAAVVPDSAIRKGANEVEILVDAGRGLKRVTTSTAATTLAGDGIHRPDGTVVPFDDAIAGTVKATFRGARVTFEGWSADLEERTPREELAVFVDGKHVYTASGTPLRRNWPPGYDGITGAWYGFILPAATLPARGSDHTVQVFSLIGGRAAELEYASGYPWPVGR
jgi:hypothetical protein